MKVTNTQTVLLLTVQCSIKFKQGSKDFAKIYHGVNSSVPEVSEVPIHGSWIWDNYYLALLTFPWLSLLSSCQGAISVCWGYSTYLCILAWSWAFPSFGMVFHGCFISFLFLLSFFSPIRNICGCKWRTTSIYVFRNCFCESLRLTQKFICWCCCYLFLSSQQFQLCLNRLLDNLHIYVSLPINTAWHQDFLWQSWCIYWVHINISSVFFSKRVLLCHQTQAYSKIVMMSDMNNHHIFVLHHCSSQSPCYDFKQLSDSCLYSHSVLGKLSIVYNHLLGSRFSLSAFRMPLVVVLSKGFENELCGKQTKF